jgi:hypothetical protein
LQPGYRRPRRFETRGGGSFTARLKSGAAKLREKAGAIRAEIFALPPARLLVLLELLELLSLNRRQWHNLNSFSDSF